MPKIPKEAKKVIVRVGYGGRISIPKEIREKMNLSYGDGLLLEFRNGTLVLKKMEVKE